MGAIGGGGGGGGGGAQAARRVAGMTSATIKAANFLVMSDIGSSGVEILGSGKI